MRTALVGTLLLVLSLPTSGQLTFTEVIEVRVANVDVIVTDGSGRPVPGLKKEDFQILEDGRRQPITNFYEVTPQQIAALNSPSPGARRGSAPAAPVGPLRRTIVLIDDSSVELHRRNQLLSSLDTFLEKTLTPLDEVMFATWRDGLKIVLPFTSDRDAMKKALDEIRRTAGTENLSVIREREEIQRRVQQEYDLVRAKFQSPEQGYSAATAHARVFSDNTRRRSREIARSIEALMKVLAGVDAKKAFIFVSGSFPTFPGREYFVYVDAVIGPLMGARRPSMPSESIAGNESDLQTSIARTANTFGIAFYGISSSGDWDTSSVENRYATERLPSVEFAAFTNTASSFLAISDATGGQAMVGGSNFLGALAQVANDMSAYYSLGYHPTGRAGEQKQISVTVSRPGLKVRTRKSTVVQTPIGEMSARVTGNLLHPAPRSDFEVRATAGQPRPQGRNTLAIPLEVRIPAGAIVLLPQGDRLRGGFSVFVGGSNTRGAVSEVTEKRQEIDVPASEKDVMAGKHWTFEVTATVRDDQNWISVGVLDEVSKATAFTRVEIPKPAG